MGLSVGAAILGVSEGLKDVVGCNVGDSVGSNETVGAEEGASRLVGELVIVGAADNVGDREGLSDGVVGAKEIVGGNDGEAVFTFNESVND